MDHSNHNTADRNQHQEHHAKPEQTIHEQHNETMQHAGHDKHAGHHTGDFSKKFWRCIILTIPVLVLSHMIQQWIGLHLDFNGDNYILLLLGSIIYFYGGMPFFEGMVSEIQDGAIGMMTLVAIAISVAFFYSVAVVFVYRGWTSFGNLPR
jgi:Cu2+-exporting ATPase